MIAPLSRLRAPDPIVEFATAADDAGIRALMQRQVMPGRVRLAFEREPDFSIGCAVTGDAPRIVVARCAATGEIVGVACRSVRRVFLNGRERRVGYLGMLRVDERFRGRWLVSRGFSLLRQLDQEDPVDAYLASIVEDNDEAVAVLVAKRRHSFPVFREVARLRTLALKAGAARRPLPGRAEIVRASIDQLRELAHALQRHATQRHFAAAWTEPDLVGMQRYGLPLDDIFIARRNGAIVGVMALWDQSAYKQSVVRGYDGWLRALRPWLPPVGAEIRCAYASLICILDNDLQLFARLLRQVYNLAHERRFAYLLVGLDAREPLLAVARTYPHFTYPSRLYLGSWSGSRKEELDGRLTYVDISTL